MGPKRKVTQGKGASKKVKSNEETDSCVEKNDAGDTIDSLKAAKETTESRPKWNLKIVSWNVDGFRACIKKGGLKVFEDLKPDIICFQETKCAEKDLPSEASITGYSSYWCTGNTPGYAGVALYTKTKPIEVKYGIGIEDHDKEGRVITAEFDKFYLVTAYVPNAGRGLKTLDYRMTWDPDFHDFISNLNDKKPVVLCGDLNVAHKEIDLANPKTNNKNAGFTKEERDSFSKFLARGYTDTFRHLYPDKKDAYTFWSYMRGARAKNVGWRLDYFIVPDSMNDNVCDIVNESHIMGSDHCPVTFYLSL